MKVWSGQIASWPSWVVAIYGSLECISSYCHDSDFQYFQCLKNVDGDLISQHTESCSWLSLKFFLAKIFAYMVLQSTLQRRTTVCKKFCTSFYETSLGTMRPKVHLAILCHTCAGTLPEPTLLGELMGQAPPELQGVFRIINDIIIIMILHYQITEYDRITQM